MSKTLGSWTYTITRQQGSKYVYITTTDGNLDYNYEYTITVPAGLESNTTGVGDLQSDYEFSFTATFYPRFVTPEDIRLDMGPVLDEIPDDTINRIILKQSLKAEDKAEDNGFSVDRSDPQEYVSDYVFWATEYQLLNIVMFQGAFAGGTKRLGDFSITKKFDNQLIDWLRKRILQGLNNAKAMFRSPRDYAILSKNDPRTHPPDSSYYGRYPKKLNNQRGKGPWYKQGGSRWYERIDPHSDTESETVNN